MKKYIALFTVLSMLLAVLPMGAFAGRFEDVPDEKWYSEGISFCAANGYMDGVSVGTFDRQSDLTRAMFMTILAKIDGVDLAPYEGKCNFGDVKSDGWYTPAIAWAAENEITGGIGDGADGKPIFGYKKPITREQIALFFYVYSEYVNENSKLPEAVPMPEPPVDGSVGDMPLEPANDEAVGEIPAESCIDLSPRADLSVFTDGDRTHDWARDAMQWAVAIGLISGTGENILDPRGNCSRAQAAVMIRAFVLGQLSECEHDWVDATCVDMGYCNNCDLKQATELGHAYAQSDCALEQNCIRCDYIRPAGEHDVLNGICGECGKENFEDAHAKLVYYITSNGLKGDGIRYYTSRKIEADYFVDYLVYVEDGETTVHFQYQYVSFKSQTENKIRVIDIEIPEWGYPEYHFIDSVILNSRAYYCLAGAFSTYQLGSSGHFGVRDYEDRYGNTSSSIHSIGELAELLLAADYLTKMGAGVSIADYGFNIKNLSN